MREQMVASTHEGFHGGVRLVLAGTFLVLLTPVGSQGGHSFDFVIDEPSDLILSGTSVTSDPLYSLRSGNPGYHTSAAVLTVLNPGATVTAVSFSYRYDTGFGPTGLGANFSLVVAEESVYSSPHLTDFSYGQNKSNYSNPVAVKIPQLSISIPAGPTATPSRLEFRFDNNKRNMQLLLPLTITVECGGQVSCVPSGPWQPYRLVFEEAPRIVAGPERPEVLGSGPWWDKVHALSATHALGWAESHLIATNDSGATWFTPDFNDSTTCPLCDAKTGDAFYPDPTGAAGCGGNDCGPFRTIGELNETIGTKTNLTGLAGVASTRYYLNSNGNFAREISAKTSIRSLPNLRMFGFSGGYTTLRDGSMIGIAKSTLSAKASPSGRLSAVAYRSTDGGSTWTFAAVVAHAEEVPQAREGPSEGALMELRNGTLMAVMRCDGQSGHYLPYISKLSDDGGLSWHTLRFLRGGGSGGVPGAGCVRPRLLSLNGSLVLAGGRPNPVSRDVLVWLNAAGDGDQWTAYSISYWHNRLNTNGNWTFPQAATNNSVSFPRLSTSYTSMVRTGVDSGYVLYGMGIRAFTMPFRLVPNPRPSTF